MNKSTQFVLVMLLLTAVGAARIFPWGEPYIQYPNKGLISQIQLFFSLETKLPAGHALRIRLPFTTAPQIASVTAYAQTSTRGTVTPPSTGTIAGLQYAARTASPFDLYYYFGSDLAAATNYVLQIQFTAAGSPQDVGWLGYVQLETLSPANSIVSTSASDIPITYDLNNAFAPIHIFQAPGTPTFSLGQTETSATPTTAAATYVQPLKLQLSSDFWFWPTIVVSWSGSAGFSFGQCVSSDTGVSTTPTPMPASAYTCSISSNAQTITINHNAPILKSQNVVYNVTITNPKNGGSTTLSVMVYHRFNLNVTDNNPSAITLNVNAPVGGVSSSTPTLSNVQALLSWGIDRKSSVTSTLQNVFQVYTSTINDVTVLFQGIRFYFALTGSLPSGTYQVVLNVCSALANCQVLENSVDHNLGSNVVCTPSNPSSGAVAVTCNGVTALQQSGNYIGVRAFFAAAATAAGAITDSQYGQIAINTQTVNAAGTTVNTAYISAIALDSAYKAAKATQATGATLLLSNLYGNGPLFGTTDSITWTAVTGTGGATELTGPTPVALAPLMGGIFVSTSATPPAMNLAFITTTTSGKLWATAAQNPWSSTAAGVAAGSGLDLFLNPNLWALPSTVDRTTCVVNNVGKMTAGTPATTSAAGTLHCYSVANTSTSNWIRLRSVFVTAPTAANVESAAGGKYMTYFWPGFVQQKSQYAGTSLKADLNVPDYYGAYYLLTGTALTNTLATASSTPTDQGDLGGSVYTQALATVGQTVFWSQYFLLPNVVAATPTVTAIYTGISVWHGSYSNSGAGNPNFGSNDAIGILRARGKLSTSDPLPSTAKLALFFYSASTVTAATTGYLPLGPAGSVVTPSTFTCFSSTAGNKCYLDRPARQAVAQQTILTDGIIKAINLLDLYQVISTDIVFTTSATQTVGIISEFVYFAAAATPTIPAPRIGFVVSTGYYYIAPRDQALAGSYGTAVAISGLAAINCDSSVAANVPNIGPGLGINTQIVNTAISNVQLNYKTTSATVATTNGYGSIVWCAQWNFQSSSFNFANTNGLESTTVNDKCVAFNYRSSVASAANWYCVYCPISQTVTNPPITTVRSFNMTNFFAGNAQTILLPSWGAITDDTGALVERSYCTTYVNAFTPGTATGSTTGSAFGQVGQKVSVSITLASTISGIDTITLEGRQNATPSSVDSSFPQASIDTNAECWLAATSDPSVSNYFQVACPTSPSGTLTFTPISITGTKTSQNGWQLLIWGLTGNTAPTTPPANQYFVIKSIRSGSLVDISASTLASNLITWPFIAATTNFTVLSPAYNRGLLNSRGTFRWDFSFPSTRPLYYKDTVVFSLDAVTTTAQNSNAGILKCRITDSVGVVVQNFRACTFSSAVTPATLTIVSLPRSITVSLSQTSSFAVFDFVISGVRVNIDGIQAIALQATKTIYGKVFFGGINGGTSVSLTKDSTASDLIAPSDVSSKAFPLNYPVVTKYWATPNSYGDLAFTLISNVQFNETCRVTIEFPTYYNPGLSNRALQPFCSIDGVNTRCTVVGPRTLQVDGVPTAKSANTQFVVRVSGIAAPTISSADNFWIQMNQDLSDSATTVIYAGAITETIIASQTITPFHINWVNVTSAPTRSSTTITWTCNPIATMNFTTNHSLHILFPPSWGLSWGVFTPTCQVVDYAVPSTIYSAAQTIVGNHVFLNFQQGLLQSQIINIVCQNIRTPDFDSTYPSQDIQVRVVDQAGSTVYQHSAPSVHNVNFAYQYTRASTLSYVNWDTATSSSSQIAPISLPRGTYAASLLLTMPSRSVRNFQITVTPSAFAFWPSPFNVSTGQTSVKTLVGCAGSTPVNNYALLFTLSDVSTYTAPPISYFTVTMNKVNIAVTSGPIPVLFVQGSVSKSYPVTIDASANPPFSDLTVTPTPPNNANITVNPASVTLTPSNPWANIVFSTTSNTVSGESNSFSFVLSGTNTNAFNAPSNLIVTATPDTANQAGNTPTFTITLDGSDQAKANSKILSLNLGGSVTLATAYLGCQIAGTWTLGQNGLLAAASQNLALNQLDPVLGQYFTVVMTKSQVSITVQNLRANTYYECQGFAVTQTNRNSSISVFTFRTGQNGGSIIRWLFNHTSWPTASQRQNLLCSLTQTLGVPALKVVAVTGEVCGNSTSFYTAANASGDVAVYFYPLDVEVDAVITLANLQAALNTTSTLLNFNNTVVAAGGLPIFNIIPDGVVTISQVSPNFPSSASTTTSSAAISGVTLNDTGFVYAAIGSNTSTTPTALALKVAAAGNSSGYIGGVQVGYYSAATGALSFNFSGLQPATTYNMYLLGTNNDATVQSNSTAVSTVSVTTQALPVTPTSAFGLIVSLMAMIISAVILF